MFAKLRFPMGSAREPTVEHAEPAICLRNLTVRFGAFVAVDGLSLTVPYGTVYGLLGLNGAGKTTTLRVLSGLQVPTSGTVSFGRTGRANAAGPGVVLGENVSPETGMSSIRYLRHFGKLHGLTARDVESRSKDLFAVLKLADDSAKLIGELSSGNKRKVEIARALLPSPAILLLDEPTRELDIPAKRAIWQFLVDTTRKDGVGIVISSHDPLEIASVCDHIGVLRKGKLAWEGTPAALSQRGRLVDVLAALLIDGA